MRVWYRIGYFPSARINRQEALHWAACGSHTHTEKKDAAWLSMSEWTDFTVYPTGSTSRPRCGALRRRSTLIAVKASGPQVVMRFGVFLIFILPPTPTMFFLFFTIHTVVLTVTAECLTALHAVCRISAAVPGFSRFLVNLRVDSAAMSSSSERAQIQPGE